MSSFRIFFSLIMWEYDLIRNFADSVFLCIISQIFLCLLFLVFEKIFCRKSPAYYGWNYLVDFNVIFTWMSRSPIILLTAAQHLSLYTDLKVSHTSPFIISCNWCVVKVGFVGRIHYSLTSKLGNATKVIWKQIATWKKFCVIFGVWTGDSSGK